MRDPPGRSGAPKLSAAVGATNMPGSCGDRLAGNGWGMPPPLRRAASYAHRPRPRVYVHLSTSGVKSNALAERPEMGSGECASLPGHKQVVGRGGEATEKGLWLGHATQPQALFFARTSRTSGTSGTPDRTRTCGLLLRRQALYPLSYGRIVRYSLNCTPCDSASTREAAKTGGWAPNDATIGGLFWSASARGPMLRHTWRNDDVWGRHRDGTHSS